MMERLGGLGILHPLDRSGDEDSEEERFSALRLFLADLLLTAGVQATIDFLRGRTEEHRISMATGKSEPATDSFASALAITPAVLAPLAAAAHATRAFHSSDRTRMLTAILNGAVIGAGTVGLVDSIRLAARNERPFSFTPLLFGYIGLLGVLLDREETAVREETVQLRRRARLLERWVPKRRTRLDRIVVHV